MIAVFFCLESDALGLISDRFIELESLALLSEPRTPACVEVQASGLVMKHLMDPDVEAPFSSLADTVLTRLSRDFSGTQGLAVKLSGVRQRVNNGAVASIRRFEIELLTAAKVSIYHAGPIGQT